jgi:hypothetical protein
MKFLKLLFLSLSISTMALSFSACDGEAQETEQTGKEYTSEYICPMHCEGSGSDQPGKCPECGMDYVKNEDHSEHHEGSHEEHHDGHMH